MKLVNKIILPLVIALVGIVTYFGMTGAWSGLFILPIITISGFAMYYLHSRIEKEDEERQEKEIDLEIEDKEAEIWIKEKAVPQTINYSKKNRRTLIIYCFLFIITVYFFWQYISGGLWSAIRDTIIASVIVLVFFYYIYFMPRVFNWLSKRVPKQFQKYDLGDWGRAYIFLLPISFIIYLLYPFEKITENLLEKTISLPLFIIIYTFVFLGLYSIIYINAEIKKDEKDQLEKKIKEIL